MKTELLTDALGDIRDDYILDAENYAQAKDTVNDMIGVRADAELTRNLRKKIQSYEEVQGTYDLSLHDYGPTMLIGSAHIQVRDDMKASEIHILTRKIAETVMKKVGIILTIGIYAANDSGIFGEMKNKLIKIIKEYKEVLQLHGFYVDEEHKRISFDIIIDFKAENPELIKNEIVEKIKKEYPDYKFDVIIDTDVSD